MAEGETKGDFDFDLFDWILIGSHCHARSWICCRTT